MKEGRTAEGGQQPRATGVRHAWPGRLLCALCYPPLVLGLALVLLNFAANSPSVKATLLQRLQAVLPGRISYDRLSISLPPLKVRIEGLRVVHPRLQRPLIQAGELEATLQSSPWELPGTLRLGQISLWDVDVELLFDEQGRPTLPDLFVAPSAGPDEPGSGPPELHLRGIDAHRVRFRMQRSEVTVDVERAVLRGEFHIVAGVLAMKASLMAPQGRVQIYPRPGERLLDIPIDGVVVGEYRWLGDGFQIHDTALVTGPGSVRVDGALWLGEPSAFSGAVALRLPLEDSFLGPLLGEVLQGEPRLQGTFHGLMDHPRGLMRVHSDSLTVPRLRLEDVDALLTLDGQEIGISSLQARALGGEVAVAGAARIFDGSVEGTLSLREVEPAPLLPESAQELLAGQVNGQVRGHAVIWGEGALQANAGLDLRLRRRSGLGPLPRNVRLEASGSYKDERLRLRGLRLSGQGHELALQGWVDPLREQFRLGLEARSGSLGEALAAAGARGFDGRVALRGRAEGPFSNPQFEGKVALDQLQAQGRRLPPAGGTLWLRQGRVALQDFTAHGDWGSLALDAKAALWRNQVDQLLPEPELEADLRLEDLDLAQLSPPRLGLAGLGRLLVTAKGSPSALSARAALCFGDLEVMGLRGQHLEARAQLERRGRRLSLELPHLVLELAGGGGLEARGKLDGDQQFTLDLRGDGIPIAEVERIAGARLGLEGRVGFGLHGEGPLLAPRVRGDLLLREFGLRPSSGGADAEGSEEEQEGGQPVEQAQRYLLGDAQFHVEVGDDQVLRVVAEQAFGNFDLDASLPLQLDQATAVDLERLEARLSFAGLQLGELLPELRAREVQGQLSGRLDVRLPGGRPNLKLELGDLRLGFFSQTLTNRRVDDVPLPLRVSFDGRKLRIEQVELDSNGRALSLGGEFELPLEGSASRSRLDLRAQGELDLAVLRPLLPDLPRLGGTLGFDLGLGGQLNRPLLEGELSVADAHFQVPALGQELWLERGRLVFEPGRVTIPAASPLLGRLGRRGAFSLEASAEIPARWPLDVPKASVRLRGERLRMALPDQGLSLTFDVPEVWVRGEDLLGSRRRIDVGGELRLASGQLVRGFTDPESLAQAIRAWFEGFEQSQSSSLPPDHPLRSLRLRDLVISGEEGAMDVQVQAAVLALHLQLRPALTLGGDLENLRIVGNIETRDGDTLSLMDREFQITRSDIAFDGSSHPRVDLEAETSVVAAPLDTGLSDEINFDASGSEEERTYHITLLLKGRLPDDLEKFELTSPQTDDQRDLWSLLLLGYRYSDLNGSGRGGDVGGEVLLASALQILSQKLSEEALKRFRLVDQLSLYAQRQDVRVQVTKRVLGGKLELLGTGTFSGGESEQSLGAKLYLREHLFLELSTTPGSDHTPMSSRLGWQIPLD